MVIKFSFDDELLLVRCLDEWGIDTQFIILIQEMSELIKEITKIMLNKKSINNPDYLNEIVDVRITLEEILMSIKHDGASYDNILYLSKRKKEKMNYIENMIKQEVKT
jgi:hypothetical protein